MTRMARFMIPLGALTALLWACQGTESPTSPRAPTERSSAARSESPSGDFTVAALHRLSSLGGDVSVSGTIGKAGGQLSIASAGVTITFAPGAVTTPTLITMTAKAGPSLAYEFAPHGITFKAPVVIQQDLSSSEAARYPQLLPFLSGAYYENDLASDFTDGSQRFARVKEIRPATFDAISGRLAFTINHFSGYMVSSGRQLMDFDW